MKKLITDSIPATDWSAIERDYRSTKLTISEICSQHQISHGKLYRQAQKGGWPYRNGAIRPVSHSLASTKQSNGFPQRLLSALNAKMQEFENRLSLSEAPNAADYERDVRTLNTLVRLFEKLNNLDGDQTPPSSQKQNALANSSEAETLRSKDTNDAEHLRSNLAQRLEKLRGRVGG